MAILDLLICAAYDLLEKGARQGSDMEINMTLGQLSMMLNQDLVTMPRQLFDDFAVSFRGVETKKPGSALLHGAYGHGKTISSAMENYAKELSGKFIVSDAGGKNRVELKMGRVTVE